jgi:hypothetical protein
MRLHSGSASCFPSVSNNVDRDVCLGLQTAQWHGLQGVCKVLSPQQCVQTGSGNCSSCDVPCRTGQVWGIHNCRR